jgi:hypothetical protein
MNENPHQFTRDAWEANAEVWDARMGEAGNDFFNIMWAPNHLRYTLVGDGDSAI